MMPFKEKAGGYSNHQQQHEESRNSVHTHRADEEQEQHGQRDKDGPSQWIREGSTIELETITLKNVGELRASAGLPLPRSIPMRSIIDLPGQAVPFTLELVPRATSPNEILISIEIVNGSFRCRTHHSHM